MIRSLIPQTKSLFRTLPTIINGLSKRFSATKTQSKILKELPPTDFVPQPYKGASFEHCLQQRKSYLFPNLVMYYKNPIMIVEGKMQWVWDEKGRRYLDCIGGIVTISVGHCHPEIVKSGTDQLSKYMHSSPIYVNPEVTHFAEELIAKMPKDSNLKNVYFVNSGSEANDLAVMLARNYTQNYDWISLRNGYHGGAGFAAALTAQNTWNCKGVLKNGFHFACNPDIYQGPWKEDDPQAVDKYVDDVKQIIDYCTPGTVAGFHAEPIQGVGGTVEMPNGYLQRVYDLIHSAGGVCISDEVQTGFGRTGTNYWGFENHGVAPDIITMAKGIGNGTPLAAVVTTPQIAKAFDKIHFNTFGGNPVSCAIGRAVLRVIEKEKLQQNCLIVGEHLLMRLKELQTKHDIIGHVRGKGLMTGVELVKDRKTRAHASEECAQVFENMKDRGVLISKGGLRGNVLRIKPPMCITKTDVDYLIDVLDDSISSL